MKTKSSIALVLLTWLLWQTAPVRAANRFDYTPPAPIIPEPTTVPVTPPDLGAGFPVSIPVSLGQFTIGYGAVKSQTLTVTPAQLQLDPLKPGYVPPYFRDGIYNLSFSVQNYFPSYPGYFTVEITFGTQELCDMSGWGTRYAKNIEINCPGPSYIVADQQLPEGQGFIPPQGNQPLVVKFSVLGWLLHFDNVTLNFVLDSRD